MKLVLALLLQIASCVALFSCKDQQNKDIDWFAAYKMPKRKDNSAAGIGSGHAFYYLDVNNKKFTPSQFSLNDTNQAVAFTLQQFYDGKSDPEMFYLLYNDEEIEVDPSPDPMLNILKDGVRMQFGHTKGVLFFNRQGGVWIVHSIPRFPPSDRYSYPLSGTNYGQSMLCVTYNYDQLTKIGTHLFFTHPNMWLSALPIDIAAENADLAKVIGGQFSRGAPFYLRTELISRDGHKFSAFGKNGDFNQDLYDGLVAWSLQTPLEVETWRRGSAVPLNCTSPYPVVDCQNMQVGETEAFKYTHDHSKIAVSVNPMKPFVCIGDINRMTTQFVRGGGTVCFSDTFVWEAYVKLTVNTNSC